MSIAEMIDELNAKRNERLKQQKLLDASEAEEKEMLAEIRTQMEAEGLDFLNGDTASVTIKPVVDPEIVDWAAFQNHIRTTGEFDLLQKRPMVSAIKARWESGNDIDGVARVESLKAVLGKVKS